MKKDFYYLSHPYNGTDSEKESRVSAAKSACIHMLENNIHVFSPILHNHTIIASFGTLSLEDRRRMFLSFDFSLLSASAAMILLKLDGWKNSYGVQKEVEFCEEQQIPIFEYSLEELLKVKSFSDEVRSVG
ncbi:MAG: DUF1937 family protein [Alphaproteobacteria bacterium]|jgi:hypothetical protein|nr:DUF1937 family protein [Alphaproteobacteria bacterium]MBT5389991.1 DUF1937 family protein [Alphaproteobacteria bacterium]